MSKFAVETFAIFLLAIKANALSCGPTPHEKVYDTAKNIFIAKVLSKKSDEMDVKIVTTFKGKLPEKIKLFQPKSKLAGSHSEFNSAKEGESYLFASTKDLDNNTLTLDLCGWIYSISDDFAKPKVDWLKKKINEPSPSDKK